VLGFLSVLIAAALNFAPVSISSGNIIEEQLELSGASELESYLPDETSELLGNIGIEMSPEGIGGISLQDWTETISDLVAECSAKPVSACLSSLCIVILCALAKTVGEKGSLNESIDTLSAAAVSLTVCVPAAVFIDSAVDAISSLSNFSAVLVPVLGGLAAASGHVSSGAAYSAFALTVIETVNVIVPSLLAPVLRVMLGLAAVSALSPSAGLDKLISSMEKGAKWLLGLVGILLSGTLGISSVAASAADKASVRAARFVISGAVPVVGGAISDAIGTISNCISIVRTSAGAFGIVAGVFIVLPTVITCVVWLAALSFSSWAAEALGASRPAAAMKCVTGILSLVIAIIAIAVVAATCSAAVIMNLRSV